MSKRNKRNHFPPSPSIATSVTTSAPNSDDEEKFPAFFTSSDSTGVETPPDDESYSNDKEVTQGNTGWDFLGGLITGGTKIHLVRLITLEVFAWIIFVSWLFVQDNSNGKLDAIEGLKYFWNKFFYVSVFAVIVIFLSFVILSIEDKIRTKNNKNLKKY